MYWFSAENLSLNKLMEKDNMRWTDSNEGQVFVFPLTVMQLKQRVN